MKTIKLTTEQADALKRALNKIIPASAMLDKREVTLTYEEVMALIRTVNQLSNNPCLHIEK